MDVPGILMNCFCVYKDGKLRIRRQTHWVLRGCPWGFLPFEKLFAPVAKPILKGLKVEYEENYYVFGIISFIAGCWHAFTVFFILHFQLIGILFAIISVLAVWSLKKFAEWLYKPTERRLIKILILSEAPVTLIFVILLFLLKYKLTWWFCDGGQSPPYKTIQE